MAVGMWGMLVKNNLVKKLIGMSIFQSAVILFFVAGASKHGATVPILEETLGLEDASLYANPLPHTLMLTAIVVSVATTGVALAILQAIYKRHAGSGHAHHDGCEHESVREGVCVQRGIFQAKGFFKNRDCGPVLARARY